MKLGAFILSFIILIQSFHISVTDVFQLNELIEHAQFHKERYGDNFFLFLSKHYGELKDNHRKEHQEEMPQHEKLPFGQQHVHSADFHSYVLASISFDIEKFLFDDNPKAIYYYHFTYSSTHKKGIFQPPKQA